MISADSISQILLNWNMDMVWLLKKKSSMELA